MTMLMITSKKDGHVITHVTFKTEKDARNHAFDILKHCDETGVDKNDFIFELCRIEDEITR